MASDGDVAMSDSGANPQNTPFDHNDPLYNFNYSNLVDADDPGFDVGSDEDDSDSDSSTYSDYDIDGDELGEKDKFSKLSTKLLDSFAMDFQTEFLKQPMSVQLILNHDASKLFKSYGRHGSQARLSAGVMDFLTKGDMVLRPGQALVQVEEKDQFGRPTGKTISTWQRGEDRATLGFLPLPKRTVASAREEMKGSGKGKEKEKNGEDVVGGKRKARDFSEDRGRIPSRPFDCSMSGPSRRRSHDQTTVSVRNEGVPGSGSASVSASASVTGSSSGRKKFRDKHGVEINVDDPFDGHPGLHRHRGKVVVGDVSQRPRMTAKQQPQPKPQPLTQEQQNHKRKRGQDQPSSDGTTKTFSQMLTSASIRVVNKNNPSIPRPVDRAQYSCTVDAETQNLLAQDPYNPSSLAFFNPLGELDIGSFFVPSNTVSIPQSLNKPIANILRLTSLSASNFLTHLTQKYTIPPTRSDPDPPSPPLALFRLGITSRVHAQLEHTFTPMSQDQLFFSPKTRGMLREMYENYKPGRLNGIEVAFLARVLRVGEDGVGVWWETRNLERRAWWALQQWVHEREVDKLKAAGWMKDEDGGKDVKVQT